MDCILAFDGGGTRTSAALFGPSSVIARMVDGPASNPVEVGPARSGAVLRRFAQQLIQGRDVVVTTVVAGISGAGRGGHAAEIAQGLSRAFKGARVLVTNDLVPLACANLGDGPAVLVIAGTGSSVLTQTPGGAWSVHGGFGTVLGEPGSAYAVAEAALRLVAHEAGVNSRVAGLAADLCARAQLGGFDGFPRWARTAKKSEIAALARAVAERAEAGEAMSAALIRDAAGSLAVEVFRACNAERMRPERIVLHGGLVRNCALFRSTLEEALGARYAGVVIGLASVTGPDASARLASLEILPSSVYVIGPGGADVQPPTESRGDGPALDRLGPAEIAERMSEAERRSVEAVAAEAETIGALVERTARAFAEGGRLIYVGAGTSGRLGVLDASECAPTFGVPLGRVLGIIAGGENALRHSVEGAEDNANQGAADITAIDPPVAARDVVVGISASGGAAYVRAAIAEAKRRGAFTGLITCNPACLGAADIVVVLDTGPEVLPGSTRLKAGTATKLALNQITTGAMALAGYVYDGLMIGVAPANVKLRARAARIVAELAAVSLDEAERLLHAANYHPAVAVLMALCGLDVESAAILLERHDGLLKSALD